MCSSPRPCLKCHERFRNLHGKLKIFAGDERGRQIIATRIIDLASTGVIDARALRDRVLLEALIPA